ncbi:MAG TPA: ABC transporter permease [Candidatus Aphodomonas merdavium]|nr:ABC transporter permease [Candidatus Aphodomonas merdavium]
MQAVEKRKRRGRAVYIAIVLTFLYLPMLMVALFSFNPSKTAGVMTGFTLEWYRELFTDKEIAKTLANSLKLAALSVGTAAVIGTAGAVALARKRMRLQGMMEGMAMLPAMVPEVVLGMAFLAAFTFAGLRLGMLTLYIAHTTFCIPYIFVLVRSRLASIDPQLEEAARDLGARPARVFFDITLPLALPAIVAGMLMAFAMSLDDVVISYFVTGPGAQTLPLKVYSSLKVGVTPEINALCTLTLGLVLIIVLIAQRIRGAKSS